MFFSKPLERWVDPHEVEKRTDLLKGYNVLVTGGAEEGQQFVDDWRPLLTRLGGTVCVKVGAKGKMDRTMRTVDIVMADR